MIEDVSPERWRRISALFDEAVGLPPERREAFVNEACAGDADLRRDVGELLEAAERSPGFLDQPAMSHAGSLLRHAAEEGPLQPTETVKPTPAPDEILTGIGRYHPLQKLGEGGMGEVWLAEQTEPIRRKVALKLIKAGMDTKQFVARFEAERQALALMDHPSIAKVFDAGETPRGLPYFAMEYVKGESITAYCDRQRLTTRERLELYMKVCEAVQHAHQKGIIHRDLKPSNVLVTIQGEKPVPKIIDFGVAKAMAQRLTEKTVYTELGALIGTPEYMSPEQAEMTGLDVDTRTDVYALGVILYELLTGALPFDAKDLRAAGFDEIRRRIREVDPPRPSTKVRTLGDRAAESARRRRTDPAKLVSRLGGDLDWITMKSLEKDRTRRYGSPSELAADIERHLGNQPVLAGPPSAAYRARKFAKRNRALVLGVVAALLTLMAGVIVSTAQYFRAEGARRDAVRARDEAVREAAKATAVTRFLQEMLASVSPDKARGREVTVREILQASTSQIDTAFTDQPLVEAAIRMTIGRTYWQMGQHPEAEPNYRKALAIRERELGAEHADVQESRIALAYLLTAKGEREEAESLLRAAVEVDRRTLGEEHATTVEALHVLGYVMWGEGKYEESERLHRQALEYWRRTRGREDAKALLEQMHLGMVRRDLGQLEDAEAIFRDGLATSRGALGNDHRTTLHFMNQLGEILVMENKLTKAEPLLQETLATRLRVFGSSHKLVGETLLALSELRYKQARFLEAEELARRVVLMREETPDRTVGWARRTLLKALLKQKKLAEARPYWLQEREATKVDADDPRASAQKIEAYARFLLTTEPETWRDPGTALIYAQRAAASAGGKTASVQITLARAYYSTRHLPRAIEALEDALVLASPSDADLREEIEALLQEYRQALKND